MNLTPCDSFAPGRALPHGECGHCGHQRDRHALAHRSLPTGSVTAALVAAVLAPVGIEKPQPVYCRQCAAGMVISAPHNPDTYQCPRCGHSGPKTTAPVPVVAAKRVSQSQRGVAELIAAHEAGVAVPAVDSSEIEGEK